MNRKTGLIFVNGEEATMTFERHLPRSLEKVWAAITEPEKKARWFGPTTIEPKAEGNMETAEV